MGSVVIYKTESGDLAVVNPADSSGLTVEEIAYRSVPPGVQYRIIDSSSLPEDATYRAAWDCDLTDPMSSVVVNPEKRAEIDKAKALADLEDWFREMTEPGFATADGIVLGMSQQDVVLLTGYYVLAKEVASLGGDIPPLMDKHGVPHQIAEIEELTAIMLAYGQRRAEISVEYAAKRAAILGG